MDSVNIFSNNRQIINKNTKFAGDSIPNNVLNQKEICGNIANTSKVPLNTSQNIS